MKSNVAVVDQLEERGKDTRGSLESTEGGDGHLARGAELGVLADLEQVVDPASCCGASQCVPQMPPGGGINRRPATKGVEQGVEGLRSGPRPAEVAGDRSHEASVGQARQCVEENRHGCLLIEFGGTEELDVADESSEVRNSGHARPLQVGPQGLPLIGYHEGTISRPSDVNDRLRPYPGSHPCRRASSLARSPSGGNCVSTSERTPARYWARSARARTVPGPMQVFGRSSLRLSRQYPRWPRRTRAGTRHRRDPGRGRPRTRSCSPVAETPFEVLRIGGSSRLGLSGSSTLRSPGMTTSSSGRWLTSFRCSGGSSMTSSAWTWPHQRLAIHPSRSVPLEITTASSARSPGNSAR